MVSPFLLATGPQLYRRFGFPEHQPAVGESLGNTCMSFTRGLFYFTTSLTFGPVLFLYLYNKGAINVNTVSFVMKYAGILLVMSFGGRLIGRSMDPTYRAFLAVWNKAKESPKPAHIDLSYLLNQDLKKYDFELKGVNADFVAVPNDKLWYLEANIPAAGPLTKAVAWYAVHAFGRHMLYPGSLGILNWMLGANLREARNLMVSTKHGKRAWIQTTEGDMIDAMYIKGEEGGANQRDKTLIITCEGNAGYYELGIANTPAQLGYSVLGWNTPGFGESTGLPFPKNTLTAAEAVMQYAHSLGYTDENIVLFGWSIGGFPASWLAANYPSVKAVVLDATFDDVLPLARSRMPTFASNIVEYAIRTYFNLEIHAIINRYKGPLRLIRRLQEEILTVDEGLGEAHVRTTNRANYLLKELLKSRHPDLIKNLEPQVDKWLAMSPEERAMLPTSSDSDVSRQRTKLFAACDNYFVDFDATHVAPLDPGYFNIPGPFNL